MNPTVAVFVFELLDDDIAFDLARHRGGNRRVAGDLSLAHDSIGLPLGINRPGFDDELAVFLRVSQLDVPGRLLVASSLYADPLRVVFELFKPSL